MADCFYKLCTNSFRASSVGTLVIQRQGLTWYTLLSVLEKFFALFLAQSFIEESQVLTIGLSGWVFGCPYNYSGFVSVGWPVIAFGLLLEYESFLLPFSSAV